MDKPKYIIGIDPGVTGAWAVYDFENDLFVDSRPFDLIETVKKNQRKRAKAGSLRTEKEYDLESIAEKWGAFAEYETVAHLEWSHAMPRDGCTQAFKFGRCFGEIRGMLSVLGVRIMLHKPNDWIRAICPETKSKAEREEKCRLKLLQMRQPDWQDRKLTDGEVDAILLMCRGVRYAQNVME